MTNSQGVIRYYWYNFHGSSKNGDHKHQLVDFSMEKIKLAIEKKFSKNKDYKEILTKGLLSMLLDLETQVPKSIVDKIIALTKEIEAL